tara:strand:+ start:2271 stop:3293 length:1023 start_codon:yes stop_codon:yes gene_type:complete
LVFYVIISGDLGDIEDFFNFYLNELLKNVNININDLNLNLYKFKMDYIQDFKNLEIPLGSSKDEIKVAYKLLSKKYHPDKNKNCNYSEFIKISESYQRLMKIYDFKIDNEDYEFYISNYISIIKYLYDVICDKLLDNKNSWNFLFKNSVKKTTKNIIIKLDVDLIDIYNCEVKEVLIKVLRKDKDKKLILKTEQFYISFLNYKEQYIFKNKSDDDYDKNNGDIIININIINKDGYYIKNIKNEKYNLYYDMDISLYEYLFGITKFIKILNMNENIIELDNDKLYHMGEYIVTNKGFLYNKNDKYLRGDFIVKFKVYNKYFKLNTQYKENSELKNLIKKYF